MAKGYVKFITLSEKRAKILFSLKERDNNDLIIFFPKNITATTSSGEVAVLEKRISVHVSPKSLGTLLKSTTSLDGVGVKTTATFVKPPKERLKCFIVCRLCSEMADESYDANVESNDEAMICAYWTSKTSCLVFNVFVGAKGDKFPDVEWCQLTEYETKSFKLAVYVNYVDLIPTSRIEEVMIATSAPQKNGVEVIPPSLMVGIDPLSDSEIEMEIYRYNEIVGQNKISHDFDNGIKYQDEGSVFYANYSKLPNDRGGVFHVKQMQMSKEEIYRNYLEIGD